MNNVKFMAIELKSSLATKLDRSGPLPWWESSGKLLPNNNTCLQAQIEVVKQISDKREMVLNSTKTKLLIVNFTDIHQYQSLLAVPGSVSPLEVTFQTKILGYWLTVDMKPDTHVKFILKIAK